MFEWRLMILHRVETVSANANAFLHFSLHWGFNRTIQFQINFFSELILKTLHIFPLIQEVVHSDRQAHKGWRCALPEKGQRCLAVSSALPGCHRAAQPKGLHLSAGFGLCSETNPLAYTGVSWNPEIATVKLHSLNPCHKLTRDLSISSPLPALLFRISRMGDGSIRQGAIAVVAVAFPWAGRRICTHN